MKMLKATLFTFSFGMTALAAQAVVLTTVVSPPPVPSCHASSWKITGAIASSAYTNTVNSVGPIQATGCAGVFAGNEGDLLNPSPNLGYLGDGLLNGQTTYDQKTKTQVQLLSPTQFISAGQLQDLKTPGLRVDPGWVMLGQLAGDAGELSYSSLGTGGSSYSLSQVLKYTQTEIGTTGQGNWLLQIDKDIVSKLTTAGFFGRSFFDHLAFSVKSGNEWAVYDFDFNKINEVASGSFDLHTAYTIKGTWTTACDFCNGSNQPQDISHMSVWARDPITTTEIPEPGSLALFGLALGVMGIASARRLKKAN